MTVKEVLAITQGRLLQGERNKKLNRFSIDSRTIKKNDVFIAVKGRNFDGHRFIAGAVRKGARALIVSRRGRYPKDLPVVLVKDTIRALGQIASYHRRQFDIPVIAVTGSAGKTTTKEITARILSSKFKVLKNHKTENNHFGVPLTLLRLRSAHAAAVIECGTNQPGDITWLARVCRPTVAVFTNIGESHLEKLKCKTGVFNEKIRLLRHTHKNGAVVFNADDFFLSKIKRMKIPQRKIPFSVHGRSLFQAEAVEKRGAYLYFAVKGRKFRIRSLAGHDIYNAIAGICCGSLLRLSYNNIYTSLNKFKGTEDRQEIKRVGSVLLINDSYNSNPVSFKSAVQAFHALDVKGRKILVCADMLELGPKAKTHHQRIGALIRQCEVDSVFTFGKYARFISKEVQKKNSHIKAFHCSSRAEVNARLKKYCRPKDTLLIKGSRAMRMEQVCAYLKEHPPC